MSKLYKNIVCEKLVYGKWSSDIWAIQRGMSEMDGWTDDTIVDIRYDYDCWLLMMMILCVQNIMFAQSGSQFYGKAKQQTKKNGMNEIENNPPNARHITINS